MTNTNSASFLVSTPAAWRAAYSSASNERRISCGWVHTKMRTSAGIIGYPPTLSTNAGDCSHRSHRALQPVNRPTRTSKFCVTVVGVTSTNCGWASRWCFVRLTAPRGGAFLSWYAHWCKEFGYPQFPGKLLRRQPTVLPALNALRPHVPSNRYLSLIHAARINSPPHVPSGTRSVERIRHSSFRAYCCFGPQ